MTTGQALEEAELQTAWLKETRPRRTVPLESFMIGGKTYSNSNLIEIFKSFETGKVVNATLLNMKLRKMKCKRTKHYIFEDQQLNSILYLKSLKRA